MHYSMPDEVIGLTQVEAVATLEGVEFCNPISGH
jgi:hypothetical protein